MTRERLKLMMIEDITLNLIDINNAAQDKVEQKYLEELKAKLEAEKAELAKEIAEKVGRLTFYYEEINSIEERLKHFNGGENDGEK